MNALSKQLSYNWSGVPVLVTGAAGFLGSHLSERLAQLGAKLMLVDDYSNAALPRGQQLAGQPVLPVRVCSSRLIEIMTITRPEVIFHLAGNAYAAGSVVDPARDMLANLASTFRLLEALRALRFSGIFVFASSAAIYGEPRYLPVDENHPACPISPYGVSKLATERYVSVYATLYSVRAVSIRLFSLYGPRQRKQVVYDLITKLRGQDSRLLLGDGSQIRDLVYVSDAVEAMLMVSERGIHDGSVYNLCSGVGITIRQLAEEVSAMLDVHVPIQFSGEKRPGDPDCWIGSPAKLADLGLVPQMPLCDGLRRTIDWFLANN